MLIIATIVFGLVIGSFLTVCVYRIPYGREKGPGDFGQALSEDAAEEEASSAPEVEALPETLTISYPRRSFCPNCKHQLSWYHNIPFFSWLTLRGKCAFCSERISVMYPAIELLTALCCLLSFTMFDLATGAVIFAFCCGLIVVSFIDIEYYIIPDKVSFPGMGVGVAIGVVNQFMHWFSEPVAQGVLDSLYGFLAGAGFLFTVSEVYFLVRRRPGLGFGDVKLLAVVGLFFGPGASLYTIFIGSLIGTIIGAPILLLFGHRISRPLPFGPYLAAGTLLYLFSGPVVMQKIVQSLVNYFLL